MSFLSEYIKSIISIAFYGFISESVCLGISKNKSLSKSFRLIINLSVFLVTISPLFSMFQYFSASNFTIDKQTETHSIENEFITLTKAELEESVRAQILKNTGILVDNISIELIYEDENIEIRTINVIVTNEQESGQITEYLVKTFGEKTTLKITVKEHE